MRRLKEYIPYPLSAFFHALHGLITAYSWLYISPGLALFMWLQFILYEAVEAWKINDKMFLELREWTAGFSIGVIVMMIVLG